MSGAGQCTMPKTVLRKIDVQGCACVNVWVRLRGETSQNKAQEVTHEDSNMHIQHFLSSGLSGSTVEEDAGGVAGRAGEQQT